MASWKMRMFIIKEITKTRLIENKFYLSLSPYCVTVFSSIFFSLFFYLIANISIFISRATIVSYGSEMQGPQN